jgi:hypothetical protein
MNPSSVPITLQVHVFTPLKGTEYVLDPIVVAPFSRLDWSPDGAVILREDPGDTLGPVVRSLAFEFSSSAAFGLAGRREGRDASGATLFQTHLVARALF